MGQASWGMRWPVGHHPGGKPDPGRQQAQHGSGTLGSQQQGPGGTPGCLHCLFPPQLWIDGTSGIFVGGM